jgi:transcription elongation GreA/GreB family factor
MNKAFVKEDDDRAEALPDHIVPPHVNLVTKQGLNLIEAQIARLEDERSAARSADASTASLDRDLRYWHERRSSAQLMEPKADGHVQFGSTVTIEREDGRRLTYRIVGIDEANPTQGTLSYVSPLAQAMMDNARGDVVRFGTSIATIVDVV